MTNFTKYMCGELATKYGDGLRVNAIAPGFFITEQNRTLLLNPDGSYTERSKTILAHTPYGRFGEPSELLGTLQWLIEIRFGHDDRDRRRFRRLLDLIGPGHHSARRESGQHDNPKTIRDMPRTAAQIH